MLTTGRREEILRVVLHQLETAGPAGFAAMHYFGMIRRKRSGGLTIRRATNVHNILDIIGGTQEELDEFKAELPEQIIDRIKSAGYIWRKVMAAFWARESARMQAERASELAAK